MKLAFSWRPFVQHSIAMALFVFLQWETNVWTTKIARTATLDSMVLPILGFTFLTLAVTVGGDRLARKLGRSDRLTYILIGALSGSITHAVALAPAAYEVAARDGAISLLIAVPALLGAAMGFLLHRSPSPSMAMSRRNWPSRSLRPAEQRLPMRQRRAPNITAARCRSAIPAWRR